MVEMDMILNPSFLKQTIINFLETYKQYKIKMTLKCEMERVDIKSGEEKIQLARFQSKIEINLKGTAKMNSMIKCVIKFGRI